MEDNNNITYYQLYYNNMFSNQVNEDEIVASLIKLKNEKFRISVLLGIASKIIKSNNLYKLIISFKNSKIVKLLLQDENILTRLDKDDLKKILDYYYQENELLELLKRKKFINNINMETIGEIFKRISNEEKIIILKNKDFLKTIDDIFYLLSLVNLNELLEVFTIDKVVNKLNSSNIEYLFKDITNENILIILIKNPYILTRIDSKLLMNVLTEKYLIDILFSSNTIPYTKALFILNNLIISDNDKIQLLKKHYNVDKESFSEAYNENKKRIIEKMLKLQPCNNMEYIIEDMKTDSTLQSNIMKIVKKSLIDIQKEEYIDKKVLELMFLSLTLYLSNSVGLSVKVYFTDQNWSQYGEYLNKEININKIAVNVKTTTDFIELINTIFHEFTHAIQEEKINSREIDYEILKYAKDVILSREVDRYYDDHKVNYRHSSLEVDARCKAFIYTYRLLKKVDKKLADEYLKSEIKEYRENSLLRRTIIRENEQNERCFLEEYFDEKITANTIKSNLKRHPILLMEYDLEGNKKSIEEIFIHYAFIKKIFLSINKENQDYAYYLKIYTYYLNYFKDREYVYVHTKNKQTYEKYQKDFKKLQEYESTNPLYLELVKNFITLKNIYYDIEERSKNGTGIF